MTIRSRLAILERLTKGAEWQREVLIPLRSADRQALLRNIADRLGMTVPELLANHAAQTGADVTEMLREYDDEKTLAANPLPAEHSLAEGAAR